jgi:hypothetical protein
MMNEGSSNDEVEKVPEEKQKRKYIKKQLVETCFNETPGPFPTRAKNKSLIKRVIVTKLILDIN